MKSKRLLEMIRTRLDTEAYWVEAVVLRRYIDGQPISFRIDENSSDVAEVPEGFSHALVVIGTRIDDLLRLSFESSIARHSEHKA